MVKDGRNRSLNSTHLTEVLVLHKQANLWACGNVGCWHICEARGLLLLLPTKTRSSLELKLQTQQILTISFLSPQLMSVLCTLATEPSPQILFGIFLKSYIRAI